MNKEESERTIKLLEKAIKEDYLESSEVREFYEMFKENKVGIFLETGELYSCNKRNAERLIKKLSRMTIWNLPKFVSSMKCLKKTRSASFLQQVSCIHATREMPRG